MKDVYCFIIHVRYNLYFNENHPKIYTPMEFHTNLLREWSIHPGTTME